MIPDYLKLILTFKELKKLLTSIVKIWADDCSCPSSRFGHEFGRTRSLNSVTVGVYLSFIPVR